MVSSAGSAFYELSKHHTIPAGLVSDPADYGKCVAGIQAAIPASVTPRPAAALLLSKCRELNQKLRLEAAELVIHAHWLEQLLAEEGITASDQEARQRLARLAPEEVPNPKNAVAEFASYLTRRRRSMPDEIQLLKANILGQKTIARLKAGGKPSVEKLLEREQAWTSKTICQPGYIVQYCKQYKTPPPTTGPSVAVLLEQLAVLTGAPCINKPACG
jgi:hypothetical protein